MRTGSLLFPVVLASLLLPSLAGCEREPDVAASIAAAGQSARAVVASLTGPGASELAKGKRAYAENDMVRALRLFLEAAEEGNADAQHRAGVMLAEGQGVTRRDVRTAARLFARAAAQGHPDAACELAKLHVFGLMVERDIARAIELFDLAAREYPPGEQRNLAAEQRDSLRAVLRGDPVPGVPAEQ